MPIYKAPLNDFRFVLYDLLDIERLTALPGFEHATPDVVDMALAEGARFAEQVLFPLNRSGDAEGCRFENGVVRTPAGFREAYQAFVDGGWVGVAADPAHGGQGLPGVVNSALDEVLCAANLSFAVYPGLTRAAYDAIRINGDDHLKRTYLDKLAEGRWTGTMCLTEPQAGSDVGLTRARAVPDGDGSYTLTGTKVFISSGEHDLAENIIHMVLARLPGAPPGTRGISMFLVPKFLPQEADGGENGAIVPGRRNAVSCGGIEHKMGLHGAATCTMNFDGATAWLVGRPHKGMRAMFVMMNAARLVVGLHALGIAEASYQSARAHARERLQGRALPGAKTPGRPADPIIVHPDIRRSLLIMKAFTEGGRALALWVALHGDLHTHHPDPEVRRAAGDLVSLMTPVVKAYLTDMGVETANLGVQVLGGYGYIREYGVEQYLRDARITPIYEGTNGIQALDLVGRKLPEGSGRLLRRFFHPVAEFLEAHKDDPAMADLVMPLAGAFGRLQQATLAIARKGLQDPDEAGAAATDYLRLFALVAVGYLWARMARTALDTAPRAGGRAGFCDAKVQTARFFMHKMLPEAGARFRAIMAGAAPVMDLPADAF